MAATEGQQADAVGSVHRKVAQRFLSTAGASGGTPGRTTETRDIWTDANIYWRDHAPPHFHAMYGGEEALISIGDLSVLEGKLSPRALGLVIEWASLHEQELRTVWQQAEALEPLSKIEPLK